MVGGMDVLNKAKINGLEWEELYLDAVNESYQNDIIALSSEAYEAICFLQGANEVYFGRLKKIGA